jgi:hypothetical protein
MGEIRERSVQGGHSKMSAISSVRGRRALAFSGVAAGLLFSATAVEAQVKPWFEFKNPTPTIRDESPFPGEIVTGNGSPSAPVFSTTAPVVLGFEGISQYQSAALGRNFIPPDTMGAVGTTQYVEILNGAFAVYNKSTGAQLALTTDNAFWTSNGGQPTGGDPRVMFNAQYNRWIAIAFGNNAKDIQIAVSDTDNALGPWKTTVFEGYNRAGLFNPIADYPTLAMDRNAIYIGTNNFAASTNGGTQSFRGTTLNVIPIADIFSAGNPTAANRTVFQDFFNTPGQTSSFAGFSIQGVNSNEVTTTGNIVTVSATDYGIQRYDITNAGTAAAARTAVVDLALNSYTGNCGGSNCAGRQPSGLRNIDALDDRISSSAYEVNGRIYTLQTIMKAGNDFTQIRYYVLDSNTNQILDQGEIAGNGFDYYQGSLAVNSQGQVVIGYNRSGGADKGLDGRISIMARAFSTDANGKLVQVGDEIMIKQSLTSAYLNGNPESTLTPSGRQRWGDYSQVSLDPTDSDKFWVIGQFAREPNTANNGNGFSRWGTYIAAISWNNTAGLAAIPEPSTWAMMLLGFGAVGYTIRRRRVTLAVAA